MPKSAQRFLSASMSPHGIAVGADDGGPPERMYASSASLTAGWFAGSSRYQRQNNQHQTKPYTPNVAKLSRHPTMAIISAAEAGAHPHQAGGLAAFAGRKPPSQSPRERRKSTGLRRAEQEADSDEGSVAARQACQHCKQRPRSNDTGHQTPLTEAVAEPAHRNLEDAVGQGKDAERVAHLRGRQTETLGYRRRCDGNADAVEVGNESCRNRECESDAASVSGSCQGDCRILALDLEESRSGRLRSADRMPTARFLF